MDKKKYVHIIYFVDKMIKWEENLFGCFGNTPYCCLVTILPFCYPVFQGCIVQKVTRESWSNACCLPLFCCCIGSAINRRKIRDRYLIPGNFCGDCLIHCFCPCCAICQEHNEVKNREQM